jgi:hypothetical protein
MLCTACCVVQQDRQGGLAFVQNFCSVSSKAANKCSKMYRIILSGDQLVVRTCIQVVMPGRALSCSKVMPREP